MRPFLTKISICLSGKNIQLIKSKIGSDLTMRKNLSSDSTLTSWSDLNA